MTGVRPTDHARPLPPGERAALRGRLDVLLDGPVGTALAGDARVAIRLARYEQLAGRETAAHERLRAVLDDPRTDDRARAEAQSQLALGLAHAPGLDGTPIADLPRADAPPSPPRGAVELRFATAHVLERLIADGIAAPGSGEEPADGAARWEEQARLESGLRESLAALLAEADAATLVDALDLLFHVPVLALAHTRPAEALESATLARERLHEHGIRVLDPFLDFVVGGALFPMLRVEEAFASLEASLAGFREVNPNLWINAAAVHRHLEIVMSVEAPTDLDGLEPRLLAGDWRRGNPFQGHTALKNLALAVSHAGDPEAARRIALADGDVHDLVLPNSGRVSVAEIVALAALAEGDRETATRMLALVDGMMATPFVLTVRGRMHALLDGDLPAAAAERPARELGFASELLRTRWLLVARALGRDARGEALSALADLDVYARETRAAATRLRAVRLFRTADAASVDRLSTRQLEVAALAAAGLSNREVAAELFLSVRTVEGHVGAALRVLGLTRRADLATVALPVRLGGDGESPAGAPAESSLTLRQGQVATLIAAGAGNADIALALGISEKTVDKHIAVIKERIGVSTRTAIAAAVVAAERRADATPGGPRG